MRATPIVLTAAFGLVLAACSHEPTNDIDAAKHAIEEARQAQAVEYAPQTWAAAQDAESKLEVELDTQAKRWPPLRSYTVAQQLAADVKATAERSKDEAATGKDKAKTEASTMMAQARDAADRASAALAEAPHGKGTQVDLAGLNADKQGVDDTIQDMQRAFDAGNFNDAKSKAKAAIDAAETIQKQVESAKAARRST